MVAEAVEQIARLALLAAPPPFGPVSVSGRILRIARCDDALIAFEETVQVGVRQRGQSAVRAVSTASLIPKRWSIMPLATAAPALPTGR